MLKDNNPIAAKMSLVSYHYIAFFLCFVLHGFSKLGNEVSIELLIKTILTLQDVMIELYRRNIWRDAKTVNVITTACFSKVTKVTLLTCFPYKPWVKMI